MNPYVILIAGWVVYFFLHSAMAGRVNRVVYVVISTAGLLALLFYNGSIHSLKFFVSEGPVRYVSLVLTTFGVMIIQTSFRQYNFKGFVGVSKEPQQLRTDGILKYVRHPILAGVILVVLGFFFFIPNLPTLISCICIFIYIPLGIYLEEKKLVALFGDQYIEYRKKVPAIIPTNLLQKAS
jgi:protein-S-isoprenylcysteine O-methyltransferase Ste14